MIIPKYIADKVIQYESARKKAEKLYKEVEDYLDSENIDIDGVYAFSVEDMPTGDPQNNGEFCDQVQYYEDCFRGTYYWPIEGGKYLAGKFEC